MAHIKINSKIVIEACENILAIKTEKLKKRPLFWVVDGDDHLRININRCQQIKVFAEYSEAYGCGLYLDHNDFNLIGEFLPNPAT